MDKFTEDKKEGAESKKRIGRDMRGFASMDPEKQKRIASMGGKASHGGGRKKKEVK